MLTTKELHIEMRKDSPHVEAIGIVSAAIKSYGPVYSRIAGALKVQDSTIRRWIESCPALKEAWQLSKDEQDSEKEEDRQRKIEQARQAVEAAKREEKAKQREFMRGYADMRHSEINQAVARCNAAHEPVVEARRALKKLLAAEKVRERKAAEKAAEEGKN